MIPSKPIRQEVQHVTVDNEISTKPMVRFPKADAINPSYNIQPSSFKLNHKDSLSNRNVYLQTKSIRVDMTSTSNPPTGSTTTASFTTKTSSTTYSDDLLNTKTVNDIFIVEPDSIDYDLINQLTSNNSDKQKLDGSIEAATAKASATRTNQNDDDFVNENFDQDENSLTDKQINSTSRLLFSFILFFKLQIINYIVINLENL